MSVQLRFGIYNSQMGKKQRDYNGYLVRELEDKPACLVI